MGKPWSFASHALPLLKQAFSPCLASFSRSTRHCLHSLADGSLLVPSAGKGFFKVHLFQKTKYVLFLKQMELVEILLWEKGGTVSW